MATYDLEDRCAEFTKSVHQFVRKVQKDIPNVEISRQVARSAGSVGANYIEANEALSKKDFLMRAKIAKKEAKETGYWLRMIEPGAQLEEERARLLAESIEIMKILGAIVQKSMRS